MITSENKTPISKIGEFKLIETLTKNIKINNSSTIKGVGDDAAVLKYLNNNTLITTDLLVEGIHFNLIYTPLKHLGYKSVIVNLSDLCAMNATPKQITVSIAISKKFCVEDIEELYSGILSACKKYNVDLIGGDTSSSLTGLLISITAIGEAKEEKIVYRNGAKLNDLICVSGNLGAAYMGLQLLEREKVIFADNSKVQPDFLGHEYLLERQLKPEARLDIIKTLETNNIFPTSMIDVSDGLSSEILHICNNSKVGCKLYLDKIPIDITTCNMADEFNIAPEVAALNGGEDYELLFTAPLSDYEKIRKIKDISIIGSITEDSFGKKLLDSKGNQSDIVAQGWNGLTE